MQMDPPLCLQIVGPQGHYNIMGWGGAQTNQNHLQGPPSGHKCVKNNWKKITLKVYLLGV
jgi:hypothetical protein